MNTLKDKVALITGGTKGIGYGVAEALLNKGLKSCYYESYRRCSKQGSKTLADKTNAQGQIIGVEADVRFLESQQAAVKQAIDTFGQLDIVVANAGLGHFGSIEDLTSEQWSDVMDTNLTGVFNSIKASVDELKLTKGYYITISSLAGTNFFAGGSAYNASKFGDRIYTGCCDVGLKKIRCKSKYYYARIGIYTF